MKRMDELIRRKATGNASEFAQKMGISVSVLKENLAEMRSLGAPIEYSRIRGSYCYTKDCRLLVRFTGEVLEPNAKAAVYGGQATNGRVSVWFHRTDG
jgi:predicted DNA-binding transcriptional regulator YafY